MNIRRTATLAAVVLALFAGHASGQTARWQGGDGDWTDQNWSGGRGPNGLPASGQTVDLPGNTGTVEVTTNVADDTGALEALNQAGGTLRIADAGALDITGNLRIGDTASGDGVVNVFGQLNVFGGLDVAYGAGSGGTNSQGELNIGGAAQVSVGGNLDTWWDSGARLSVSGADADIQIDGTFYLGPTATMTANINSDSFSTVEALEQVGIQGGTLEVNFSDGYVPALGASWTLLDSPSRTGTITNTNLPDLGPGSRLTVNYSEGGQHGQIVTLDYTNTLNLKVDPASGEASIENPLVGGIPFDIDGYIIRSESASLQADGLAGVGNGWQPGLQPSQSDSLLSESNLFGSVLVPVGQSLPIGAIFDPAGSEDLTFEFHINGGQTLPGTVQFGSGPAVPLQAGDADQNLEFNQLDLVKVQIAAKYLTGEPATWGDGDWDGAPGGRQGNPPTGNGFFDQLDIIAALTAGTYLTGPYGAVQGGGVAGDGQASVVYNAGTGELSVDAPAGQELSSINIDSASGIFTGESAQNLGGSFDNDADGNVFKATFGGSFGSLSFGNVAQTGLSEAFLQEDLTVVGSLAGGGDLGDVDLIYVPEPTSVVLLALGLLGLAASRRKKR